MAKRKLEVIVTEKGAQATSQKIGGVDKSIAGMVQQVALATAGLYALKKGFDFLKGSTDAAIKQEETFLKLKNAIEITGKSWDSAKPELDALFTSLQKFTKYGDTDSAEVFQKLITLTGDYDTAMTGLPLTLDLAASGLFDAGTAARMVGMALTGNIEMLGRYIPEFKAANNEALKSMDAHEKAAFAVDVLTEKFGGLAEKELASTSGALEQLTNYWGDFREMIGDRVTPTINKAALAATDFFKSLTETSLEGMISDLEDLGVAAEYIMDLRAIQWQDDIDEINKKLFNVQMRYKTSEDISKRISDIDKERVAALKEQSDYQYKNKSVLEDEESIRKNIYDNFLALYGSESKAQSETEKYMSNQTNMQNYQEQLRATAVIDQKTIVDELNKEKRTLIDNLGLIIEKETLQAKINSIGKDNNDDLDEGNAKLSKSLQNWNAIKETAESISFAPKLEDVEDIDVKINFEYGEIQTPDIGEIDFGGDQEEAAKARIELLKNEMSVLVQYRDLGLNVSGQLTEVWQQYVSDTATAYGEDSQQYMASVSMKQQADEAYLEWKKEKYIEEHELQMQLLDDTLDLTQRSFETMLDSEMSFADKKRAIGQSIKDTAVGFLADMVKEYIKSSIINAGISKATQAANTAAAVVQGRTIQVAMAPAALATLIATSGGAAVGAAAGAASAAGALQGAMQLVKAETGFEGMVDKPTMFLVGEKNRPELVSVTPKDRMDRPELNFSQPEKTTNINFDTKELESLVKKLIDKDTKPNITLNVKSDPLSPITVSELAEEGDMQRNVN